jgi:putative restriction endonuclease
MSTLSDYQSRFARLRTDRNRVRWTGETQHRAPHKPFLLLAVMDLIAHGKVATNFIPFTPELRDAFDLYWTGCFGPERPRGNPVLPYFHLRSDGFWHLLPVPGQEAALAQLRQVSAMVQLKALVLGVALDPALYDLLSASSTRAELQRVLLATYFTPDARSRLVEAAQLVDDTLQYGQHLLGRVHERFALEAHTVDQQYRAEARSVAFRRIVVEAYAHACALCGVRLLTPEGRTAVVAAHIVPWRVTHNDDPRNGLALCGLHHWTFDEGLVTVERGYTVKVSPVVRDEEGSGALRQIAGDGLRLPSDPDLAPAAEALAWHADHVYRSSATRRLL